MVRGKFLVRRARQGLIKSATPMHSKPWWAGSCNHSLEREASLARQALLIKRTILHLRELGVITLSAQVIRNSLISLSLSLSLLCPGGVSRDSLDSHLASGDSLGYMYVLWMYCGLLCAQQYTTRHRSDGLLFDVCLQVYSRTTTIMKATKGTEKHCNKVTEFSKVCSFHNSCQRCRGCNLS